MADPAPKGIHLADLHEIAARLGVPRFRMLTRDELAEQIRERGGAEELDRERGEAGRGGEEERERPAGRRRQRGRRGGRGAREREGRPRGGRPSGEGEEEREPGEEDERRGRADGEELEETAVEPVTGVLDVTPRGFGFLRLQGLEPAEGDV